MAGLSAGAYAARKGTGRSEMGGRQRIPAPRRAGCGAGRAGGATPRARRGGLAGAADPAEPNSSEDFAARARADGARWGAPIRRLNLVAE